MQEDTVQLRVTFFKLCFEVKKGEAFVRTRCSP